MAGLERVSELEELTAHRSVSERDPEELSELTARHSAYTRCTLHTHALSLHSTRARAALKSRRAPLPLGFILVDEIL